MFERLPTTPVRTTGGLIDVFDSGGTGQPIVFVHGVAMDHTLWTDVIAQLRDEFRCIAPVLPLGGHRRPMGGDTDLTMNGIARLLADVVAALELPPAILVASDWGGPQITAVEHPDLFAGLVLTPQEAFDNYMPGLPGKFVALACRLPGGLRVAARSLRVPGTQRLPMTFGRMTVRPIPREMIASWTEGLLTSPGVRADARRFVATTPKGCLLPAAEQLGEFPAPTRVVWSTDNRTMPRDHGRALAELIPNASLVELDDCSVLMPLDQPERLANEIRTLAHQL